ncbi:MAG TPA: class I SAM-dependent methyltransferase [Candidatus Sumerlaeota bacterium]|nr:class I SAM-dependent methyltransferase [Candidatus Sumerlaeota bacterium]HRR31879.1 class I SAM-dependent methyltransferase [Candidatus Sumerlaeia bacterium]HON50284.1 class I SAM-dependent methyltransferase [Candidatus Sumerlaeota bacterium]HOR63500.1 class I SAM-dependent methyltransferase [Candidatus Sumerlaeota bacterium]HPL73466.1 class I SAM-dependent methyltransferase [Candidatus Sumerlaeota bacterium]
MILGLTIAGIDKGLYLFMHMASLGSGMNPEEYSKMYAQENTYWWFQGRKKILFRMIERFGLLKGGKARALDIGCGTGLILEELNGRATALGLDFSHQALSFCKKRGLDNLISGDVSQLPIADSSLDLVLALDLFEHVKDDVSLVRDIYRILKPGGYLLATVPAHQYLWSSHDEALHHFRRYSHSGFRKLIAGNGFTLEKYSFLITFTYFPILAFRIVQKVFRRFKPTDQSPKTHIIILPNFINAALIRVLEMEGMLLERMNLPIGVSLICIAKK